MATVLVVDDRPANRELVRTVLGYYGHHIVEADDGQTALDLIRATPPELVITDVLMPGLDGYDLVREMRAAPASSAIPVIFYTANYLEEEAEPIAAALGVSQVVSKSGDVLALVHAVDAALVAGEPAAPTELGEDFTREHLRVLNAKLVEKIRELEEKDRLHTLVEAAVSVGGDLSLSATLGRVTAGARGLVGATYAAIRTDDGALLQLTGVPPDDPDAGEQLAVPIRVRGRDYAALSVVRTGAAPFSAADRSLLATLASAAGAAIANAELYDDARRRQAWLSASAEITSALLTADPAEALELVVRGARQVAGAALAWLVVLTDPDRARVEACDGDGISALRGRDVNPADAPFVYEIVASGRPLVVAAMNPPAVGPPSELARTIGTGPLMGIPLLVSGERRGALMFGNRAGAAPFGPVDVEMATTFAGHASLALEFARAEADRRQLTVVEERERIARDLHDLVIQRLFAVGLHAEALRGRLPGPDVGRLDIIVEELDETIDAIRTTIFSLQSERVGTTLRTELIRLTEQAGAALGFVPRLRMLGPVDLAVPETMYGDVLATVREALSNVARHSGATGARVDVEATGRELVLRISDNGAGLPDERRESGLANLRHRAEARGGSMSTARAQNGRGLVLVWRAPITVVAHTEPAQGDR